MTNEEIEEKIRSAFSQAAPDDLDKILSICTPMRNGRARTADVEMTGRLFSEIILDVNPSICLTVDEGEKISHAVPLNEDGEKILSGLALDGTSLDIAVDALVSAMVDAGYLNEAANSVLVSVADDDTEKESILQKKVSQVIADAVRENLADTGADASVIGQPLNDHDEELARLADTYGISMGKAALIRRMIGKEDTKMEEKDKKANEQEFKDMANMSVNDIALLEEEEPIKDDAVTRIGRASDKAYIGHKGALKAALSYTGMSMKDVYKQKVKMGRKKGLLIYKVKIKGRAGKFKFYLDARTGEMVRCKKMKMKKKYYKKYGKKYYKYKKYKNYKHYKHYNPSYTGGGSQMTTTENNSNNTNYANNANYSNYADMPLPEGAISPEAAKQAALSHAGLTENEVAYVNVHPEFHHGNGGHYDVKFVSGGMKYKYAIGLYDGAVLGRAVKDKVHKTGYVYEGNYHEHVGYPMKNAAAAPAGEPAQSASGENPANAQAQSSPYAYPPQDGEMISEDEALNIAMEHAGLTMENLIRWKIKLRTKHGRTLYRIKLKIPGFEHEIDVDAYTKAICKDHKEVDY